MNESLFTGDSPLFALGFGLLLGLKHATEPDHLVAVSTVVSEHRSPFRSALVGAWWGVGHTASLLVAGVLVIILRIRISERTGTLLELVVALMIVLLGAQVLRRAFAERTNSIVADPVRRSPPRTDSTPRGWRPLLVGMMHGLAGGSGVLALLPLAVIASPALGLLYLLLFGAGSIVGMLLMSFIISLPFVFTADRAARFNTPVRILAGLAGIAFGLFYAWEKSGEL